MAEQQTMIVDFSTIEGPVYTGRGRGEQLREKYKLDEADKMGRIVEIVIPDTTYSINSSFFLGFFGRSVVHSGTLESFFKNYHFKGPAHILSRLRLYAARALQEKDLFDN